MITIATAVDRYRDLLGSDPNAAEYLRRQMASLNHALAFVEASKRLRAERGSRYRDNRGRLRTDPAPLTRR